VLDTVIHLAIAVVCTEALVELFQSRLFDFVRNDWFSDPDTLKGYFVRCGFCESFWAALLVVSVGSTLEGWYWAGGVLVVFRLSNVWHDVQVALRGCAVLVVDRVFTIVQHTENKGE